MANQIVSVLDNPDLATTLAENGKVEMAAQTWKKSVDKMVHHYHHHIRQREVAYMFDTCSNRAVLARTPAIPRRSPLHNF